MTLYGFAWGLTAVVVVVAGALAIQALWLLRRTRRLRRERLGEMLRQNLDLRFPGQSQAGPRAGSSPPR